MAAYGVTLAQVNTAMTSANVDAPVGSIQQGQAQLDVRSLGSFQTIDQLSNLIVTQTTSGGPILLKDLATVGLGYKQQTQLQRLNGQDAVGLQIVKQSDANALQVADSVRVALAKLQNLLPSGSQVVITNDTSVFTRASLDAIQHDLLLSVLLVGGVMLLFLHAWRHTVIVLLAIPTSLVSTFLVMYALGFSLNIMSLMALALMIGILVDDSIVVLENIHRHLGLGENPLQAAITGRGEIGMAAIAITMADVVVYTPIAFISGVLGQLFRQYGLTVVAATLFSLLISFTLTPMLASRWLQHKEKSGRNPLDRSFVTGYGARPMEHPHHRFWAHSLDPAYPPPPPGVLSGGPNNIAMADEVAGLPSELPADEEAAKRFDVLLLGLQLCALRHEPGFERLCDRVKEIVGLLEE